MIILILVYIELNEKFVNTDHIELVERQKLTEKTNPRISE